MTIKQQGGIFGRNPTFNNVTTDGAVTFQGSNNPTVTFRGDANNQNTNPYGSIEFYNADGSAAGPNIAAAIKVLARNGVGSGGEIALFTSDGAQGEGVAAPETIRIDGLGNIVIKNSGSGIDFSATSGTGTSELFDDYEEGTWTPTKAGDATGAFSNQWGSYVKIGRFVLVQFQFAVSVNFTATSVGGLPFTPAGGGLSGNLGIFSANATTTQDFVLSTGGIGFLVAPNTTAGTYRGMATYQVA
jgi:hypothetical protein